MTSLTTIASTVTASFLASFVEVVEAFTIVLAVGVSRSWRPAFTGMALGLAVLGALILILGPLLSLIPLHLLQFAIGVLLILFGMRWLRKAILRAAGFIASAVRASDGEIVWSFGAGRGLIGYASLGAAAAGVLVLAIGLVVHRPLSRVPENTLKFVVGVMLTSFGIFWTGEGLGANWPGADGALIAIALLILAVALGSVRLLRGPGAAKIEAASR